MLTQPQAQLEMQWILEGDQLQSVWTARQSQLIEVAPLQTNLDQIEGEAA